MEPASGTGTPDCAASSRPGGCRDDRRQPGPVTGSSSASALTPSCSARTSTESSVRFRSPALDAGEVARCDPELLGQSLLGESPGSAEGTHLRAQDRSEGLRHRSSVTAGTHRFQVVIASSQAFTTRSWRPRRFDMWTTSASTARTGWRSVCPGRGIPDLLGVRRRLLSGPDGCRRPGRAHRVRVPRARRAEHRRPVRGSA